MSDPITPTPPVETPPAPAPAPQPAPPPAQPQPPVLSATVLEAQLRNENARLSAERDQAVALANASTGIREQLIRARAEQLALGQGLVDPGLARFLPIAEASVDAAGNVQGLDKVVTGWRTAAPGAFKAPSSVAPIALPPPAPPAAPEIKSFGPGLAAPPTNTQNAPVDVRKLDKKQVTVERQRLREAAIARDRAAGVH